MVKIQKQICECCGGSSFKNIGNNRIQCEYCDSIFVDVQNSKNPFIEYEEYKEQKEQERLEKIRREKEEKVRAHEKQLEETYNKCVEIEVKRKKLNRLFLILMVMSLVISAFTGGISALFSIVFLYCIVWNDSRQKTRNAQAFIKQYLSERV